MTQQVRQGGVAGAPAAPRRTHQQKVGLVVSNKMDKTIVVAVERLKMHPLYKKTYKQTRHFYAHDEKNACQIGDTVRIEECRPLSKLKRWRLVEILKRGSGVTPVEEVLGKEISSELERVQGRERSEAGAGEKEGAE
jgi:small subunit ribosomal protein S17